MTPINLTAFHRYAFAYCDGCQRYVERVPFPVCYGWICDQHALGRTVIIGDDMTVEDRPIKACMCQNPKQTEQEVLF